MKASTRFAAATTTVWLFLGACAYDAEQGRPLQGGECTTTATTPDEARTALDGAEPGQVLCFSGPALAPADLELTRSGTAQEPITLRGVDVTTRSVAVAADHVVVEDFTTDNGDGLVLAGTGITARANTVRNAVEDGISCGTCTDALLENNTVVRADGTGIIVEGERITLLRNNIRESIRKESGDADGIRFFGHGHRIRENEIRDIKDDGYPGEPPHTDCFQTYDNSRPATTEVEITGNICHNVDHQCLIATAEQSARSHTIHFTGNTCSVEGKQAVLLQWFPGVEVRNNQVSGPNLERGVILLNGSINGAIFDNRFIGDYRHFEADESSLPGLQSGNNSNG